MDFKKTFLLVLCCFGVVSSGYAADGVFDPDDEFVNHLFESEGEGEPVFGAGLADLDDPVHNFVPEGEAPVVAQNVSQAVGPATSGGWFANSMLKRWGGRLIDGLTRFGDAQIASQVEEDKCQAAANQWVVQRATSIVQGTRQRGDFAVHGLNQGASQIARSTVQMAHVGIQSAPQMARSTVQGLRVAAQRTSQFVQESPVVGPVALTMAAAVVCPPAVPIGIAAGITQGVAYGIMRPVGEAARDAQLRVNDSINGARHLVVASGQQGERVLNAFDQFAANQQQRLEEGAVRLEQGVVRLNEGAKNNVSFMANKSIQGLVSAASLLVGARLVHKHLMKYKGRKSAALAAIGGLMVVVPVVAPAVMAWLTSNNTPVANNNALAAVEQQNGVQEDNGAGLPH